VSSIDPQDRKAAIAPKALLLANGGRDDGIDIETVKKFVKDLRRRYAGHPDRLALLEEPRTVSVAAGALALTFALPRQAVSLVVIEWE
jgi:hypothetical protein